ncbi:flagellar export protein FliJ [Trichlorobacter ammonificans]|uniref:Flagellar FliJ protein n=1 Tax=Trichlorobacter ammonificans TaxID=2916410 RepID=A0ABM9D421_9BACT|nr:flagellar export protein FliJ [Trichlorobacter ammonificans]CAH2029990.1 Flagellar FliJ protein [Trichlorobacter ammonificans]
MSSHKRFGLHQVLSYRKELERLRKLEFAAAKRNLDDACDLLEQEQRNAARLADEFAANQEKLTSVVDLQLYANFFARKRQELKVQQARIEELDQMLEVQRQQLQAATTEKKVMEQLKVKQDAAFRKEQAHKEALLLDEIAVQKKGQE